MANENKLYAYNQNKRYVSIRRRENVLSKNFTNENMSKSKAGDQKVDVSYEGMPINENDEFYQYNYLQSYNNHEFTYSPEYIFSTDESFKFDYSLSHLDSCSHNLMIRHNSEQNENNVPDYMLFHSQNAGFYFGIKRIFGVEYHIGKPQEIDGHILVVGGAGSGKSSCIAIPTLHKWKGSIFAIDVKGELANHYNNIKRAKRPTKVLNLTGEEETLFNYDPYYFLRQGGKKNLVQRARELAQAIIPRPNDIRDPFWLEAAQSILIAAILYYLDLGMGFIETMVLLQTIPFCTLINDISISKNEDAKMHINQFKDIVDLSNSKMIEGVKAELSNKVMLFATDPQIMDALTPSENTIKWEDLETYNIFLSIDECKLEQWERVITLMLTQLIKSLERRPDKYSPQGLTQQPVLLLLDEFPRIGRLDVIKNAITTLRSRGVTICLMIQSIAQLDDLYGMNARRIIVDNCNYQAILSVTDPDNQEYFSKAVGSIKVENKSLSTTYQPYTGKITGYSYNISEAREPIIYPHEFNKLDKDMMLKTPSGFCRVEKVPFFLGKIED